MEGPKPDEHLPPAMATVQRTRRQGREVCSRYMIPPSPRSAPSSPIHPPSTPSTFRNQLHYHKPRVPSVPSSPDASDSESEPSSSYADENQHSFVTPLPPGMWKAPNTLKRRAVKLFSDNTSDTPQTLIVEHHKVRPPTRVGTPMARDCGVGTPRTVLYSQTQLRSTKKTANHGAKSKALFLFPDLMDSSSKNSCSLVDSGTESHGPGGLCDSPPIRIQSRARQTSDLRSSMPEADLLPTTSRKPAGVEELMLRHSLNSVRQPSPFDIAKTVGGKSSVQEMCHLGRVFLPPQPPSNRLGLDVKKGKKGSSRKEGVALSLLHNQYLQWRFVNAVAKTANEARSEAAERSLSEVHKNLKGLRDLVIEKRMEFEKLLRLRRLFDIINVEMPNLEEWASADGEYSESLSGTIKALKDASIRLPVNEDARVDIRELEESIHSATTVFESFSPSIERFLPKADGVAKEMSELAKIVTREKALFEECGGLLSEAQRLQVKECSLRSMLMQVKKQ